MKKPEEMTTSDREFLADIIDWGIQEQFQFINLRAFLRHDLDKRKDHRTLRWELEWLVYATSNEYSSERITAATIGELREKVGPYMHDKIKAPTLEKPKKKRKRDL